VSHVTGSHGQNAAVIIFHDQNKATHTHTVPSILFREQKTVQNRFVSKLFWTFTTFFSQGTVNRISDPCMDGETGPGEEYSQSWLNLRSAWSMSTLHQKGIACGAVYTSSIKKLSTVHYIMTVRWRKWGLGHWHEWWWYVDLHPVSPPFLLSLPLILSDALALPLSLFFPLCHSFGVSLLHTHRHHATRFEWGRIMGIGLLRGMSRYSWYLFINNTLFFHISKNIYFAKYTVRVSKHHRTQTFGGARRVRLFFFWWFSEIFIHIDKK